MATMVHQFYTILMVVKSLNLWDVQLTWKSQNIFSLTPSHNWKQPRYKASTTMDSTWNKDKHMDHKEERDDTFYAD